jgi:hypothetical protein
MLTADKRNRWFSVVCDFVFLFSFFLKLKKLSSIAATASVSGTLGAIGPAKPLRNTGYFFLIFSRDQESSSFPAQAFGYEIAENCIFKASA